MSATQHDHAPPSEGTTDAPPSESTTDAPPSEGTTDAPPFDTILDRLEKIVEKLEDAELPLEESLRAFEEGITLSRQGQGILDEAEHKIEVLLASGKTLPLDPDGSRP